VVVVRNDGAVTFNEELGIVGGIVWRINGVWRIDGVWRAGDLIHDGGIRQ